MEPAKATKIELLQANVDAAKSRLRQAQVELDSVLNLLPDLPPALKTGVMRAIESAFDDLGQAENHLIEMESAVSVQLSKAEPVAPLDHCPHCLRPYTSAPPNPQDGASGPPLP
ncbi:MAG: hypothetical protein ACOY0T_20360 [Myxococcota bacterium]